MVDLDDRLWVEPIPRTRSVRLRVWGRGTLQWTSAFPDARIGVLAWLAARTSEAWLFGWFGVRPQLAVSGCFRVGLVQPHARHGSRLLVVGVLDGATGFRDILSTAVFLCVS